MYRARSADARGKHVGGGKNTANKRPGLLKRIASVIWITVDRLFGALSTAVLLAIIVTIPILQFFALGYLLNAARRLAKTGRLREAFAGAVSYTHLTLPTILRV